MKDIAIVILNYNTYDLTVDCVNSILAQDYPSKNMRIIIVDNFSTDDSLEKLKNQYHNTDIILLSSKRNLGFANGNNLGILYARERLNISNIFLVNSDILFLDKNLITTLMNNIDNNVAVIGPEIFNINNEPAYLSRLDLVSYKNQKKDYLSRSIYLKIRNQKLLYKLYKLLKKNRKAYIAPIYKGCSYRNEEVSDSMWIPGCAFLLTENYFKNYKMLYPYTFMYYEESILAYLCKKKNLKLKYIKSVHLLHKDGKSTETIKIADDDKNIRKLQWMADSSKILLKVIKKNAALIDREIVRFSLSLENDAVIY